MSITALAIINRALSDIGVRAPEETIKAWQAQDGLARLNELVVAWANQPLTIPVVNRLVFPVVSNVNTYTIGIGGDFNTHRPLGLEAAGLLLNADPQTYTITAVSDTDNTFTIAGDHSAVFTPGTSFNVVGSTANDGAYTVRDVLFSTSTIIQTLQTVLDATVDGTINVSAATSPTEIPLGIMTDDTYQSLVLKDLTGTLFTNVYLNQTYPLATIFLSPTPNTAVNDLVLYVLQQLDEFADLVTEYDFPQGYVSAFEWNLAELLIPSYAVAHPVVIQSVQRNALKWLANIKRTNTKMEDIANNAANLKGQRQGIYNIFSDTGG